MMKKQVSTSTGLLIIFAAVVIIFGGAYAWANLNPPDEINYYPSYSADDMGNQLDTYENEEL